MTRRTIIALVLVVGITASAFYVYVKAQENRKRDRKSEDFTTEYGKKLHEQIKRQREAFENAKAEVLAHPESAEAHFNLANAYHNDAANTVGNNYDKIANEYRQAIKLNPNYAESYNGLAIVYGQMNQFKKQFEAFDKAISLKPDYAEAYCHLGFAHLWENIAKSSAYPDFEQELKLAVKAFEQAIQKRPDYAEAYSGLGQAYHYLNLNERAVESFTKSMSLDPNSPSAHIGLCWAYIELGNKEAAMKEHDALVRLGRDAQGDDALKELCEDGASAMLTEIERHFAKN